MFRNYLIETEERRRALSLSTLGGIAHGSRLEFA